MTSDDHSPVEPLPAPVPRAGGLRGIMARVGSANLLVQMASFVSSIALAHVLGADVETDAYYLGLSVPVLAYGLLQGALRSGAIPALTEVAAAEGEKGLKTAASELVTAVVVASLVVSVAATVAAELALPAISSGRLLSTTRLIAAELAPYAVFGAVAGVLSAVLAVRRIFLLPVLVLALEPALKTVLTFTLGNHIGVQALVLGNLVGAAVANVILWRAVARSGVPLRLGMRLNTPFVRGAIAVSVPLIVSMSVLQVNPIVDRAMATHLGAGSVTALELGLRLFTVPASLATGLLIAPITATWAARKAAGGWQPIQASLTRALSAAAVVVPPVVALAIVLRRHLVLLLFSGGAYPRSALNDTADVFAMIMLSLPGQMLVVLLATLFIVYKDTIFPMKVALANVVLNVALNFALRPVLGVAGIALSTSLTVTILLAAYIAGARRRWGALFVGRKAQVVLRAAAATAVTGGTALLVVHALPAAETRGAALMTVAAAGLAAVIAQTSLLAAAQDPLASDVLAGIRRLRPRMSR